MMDSSFWNGYLLENFLFSHINITSPGQLIGVCIIISAVAFCFEATRTSRDWLYLKFLTKRSSHGTTNINGPDIILKEVQSPSNEKHSNGNTASESKTKNGSGNNCHNNDSHSSEVKNEKIACGVESGGPVMAAGTVHLKKNCQPPKFHIGLVELSCSTLLHMCQVILGYILMLVVMTFNVWIFLAVLIGVAVGFFVFDGFNKKIHSQKSNARS